ANSQALGRHFQGPRTQGFAAEALIVDGQGCGHKARPPTDGTGCANRGERNGVILIQATQGEKEKFRVREVLGRSNGRSAGMGVAWAARRSGARTRKQKIKSGTGQRPREGSPRTSGQNVSVGARSVSV